MCGIFGITGHEDAARLAYFGLYALQHRGQESAGIATWDAADGGETHVHIGMGLVPDVFTEEALQHLPGDVAIGHIRYSTTGKPERRNAQPLVVRMRGGMQLALAHNGNLTNAAELRAELEDDGAIFQTSSDSEIFVHLISHGLKGKTLEEAILAACSRVEGAYCLVILANGKLIALRDPHGFHPLSVGRMDDAWVFASESCALDLLEAERLREVRPGEMIVAERGALDYRSYALPNPAPVRQCIFELVYFARPDSIIFGEDVYQCRKRMGLELVNEAPADVDCVIPFPDSGIYAALGVAQGAGVPYEHALIRNHYVGRTFIQPSQSMRQFSVRVKINPVHSMIENKRLFVVDDSIVRGTTVRTRVAKLRDMGASEVHFRVSCPPIKHPCFYGIDFPSAKELVAVQHAPESLAALLGLDSLHYLSLEGLKRSVSCPDHYCTACFDGVYPTALPVVQDKYSLEYHRK